MKTHRILTTAFLWLVATVSFSILTLSFLAALTETYAMVISHDIYALLRTFCHQVPSRCLWYANSNFGICSHCFGIFSGVAVLAVILLVYEKKIKPIYFSWLFLLGYSILSVVPLLADVTIAYYHQQINEHSVRVFTGFVAGMGGCYFVYGCFLKLIQSMASFLNFSKTQREVCCEK